MYMFFKNIRVHFIVKYRAGKEKFSELEGMSAETLLKETRRAR